MHFLVIGGTGFIGSAFAARAIAAGHRVRIVSRNSPAGRKSARVLSAAEYITGDFADAALLDRATAGVDICVHAASTTNPSSANHNMEQDVAQNLVGSIGVLRGCLRSKVKRVVLISSGGTVYGRAASANIPESAATEPVSAYGIVKLAIEKYFALFSELYGLDYRITRLSNPYGPGQRSDSGQGVVAAFVERILKGEALVVLGDGSIVRDFIYIDDAVEALLRVCSYAGPHRVFNVGSGLGTSIQDIIDLVADLSRHKPKIEYRAGRKFDVPANVLCCDRARQELNWAPTIPLASGLQITIDAKAKELAEISAEATQTS